MNRTQQKRLWVAILLFFSFLMCFFMNITGLAYHQWIGVLCGLIVSYHLLAHRAWVKAVTIRFFGNTSSQVRLFYLIDFALLIGFVVMVGTGLLISTWLNLTLAPYGSWRTVHILASITTLLAVIIKIGVHARWIICTASKMLQKSAGQRNWNAPLSGATTGGERRAFLKLMGIVGTASVIAISTSAKSLWPAGEIQDSNESSVENEVTEFTDESTNIDNNQDATRLFSETAGNQVSSTTPTPTNEPQINENKASAPDSCTVRCSRGCSYPGHCRRYVDSNSNNRCDLGECLS